MGDEQEALLRAIGRDHVDDLPRLVYADWLDEHGEPDRPGWPANEQGLSAQAELIRLQLGAGRSGSGVSPDCRSRYDALRAVLLRAWFRKDVADLAVATRGHVFFACGFVAGVHLIGTGTVASGSVGVAWSRLCGRRPPAGPLFRNGLVVDGDVDLRCLGLRCLPDDLRVTGRLSLGGNHDLSDLPPRLRVGDLSLSSTGVTHLPPGLVVSGTLGMRPRGKSNMRPSRRPVTRREAEAWLGHPGLSDQARRSALASAGYADLAALVPCGG